MGLGFSSAKLAVFDELNWIAAYSMEEKNMKDFYE